MKYCPKCGAECDDNASFCAICGNKLPESGFRPTNQTEDNGSNSVSGRNFNNSYENNNIEDNSKTLGILAIVFGIIGINLIGLILGIIGLSRASKANDSSSKSLNIVGIAISSIHMIVQIILAILYAAGVISYYFYI